MKEKEENNSLPVCDWGNAISVEQSRATTLEIPSVMMDFHIAAERKIAQGIFIDDAYPSTIPEGDQVNNRPTQRISEADLDALRHRLGPLMD